jgi:hypothetical protein
MERPVKSALSVTCWIFKKRQEVALKLPGDFHQCPGKDFLLSTSADFQEREQHLAE